MSSFFDFLGTIGGFALRASPWGWALQGALVVYGINASKRQARDQRNAYNASLKDRKVTIRSSDAPRTNVYGSTVTSGPLIYAATAGDQSETMYMVIALGAHEFESIDDILFDGESIGALDGNGWVQDGSKYFVDKKESRAERVTGPAAGGSVVLDESVAQILAVSLDPLDSEDYHLSGNLLEGSQWIATTTGVSFPTAIQTGLSVVITYKAQIGGARVRVQTYNGLAAGERNTELETATAGLDDPWLSTDVCAGIPNLQVTLIYDDELFSGVPNISALVKGKKLYDPRTGQTKYSDGVGTNPALVIRDFLTGDQTVLGFGCTASEIDDTAVIAAANLCDDLVAISPVEYQVRYLCDGVVYADASPKESLEALLTSCIGTAVWSQGQWRILPAAEYAIHADNHYDDDDLATGPIDTQQGASFANNYNAVRGQFIDPDNKYALNDFPPYVSATYIAQDNNETFFRDFDFPFCDDPIRAQRMAKLLLYKSREAIVDSAWYKMQAIRAQPGDVVGITRTWDGWEDKRFIVAAREFDPSRMAVRLMLREDATAIYDDGYGEWRTPDPSPNTTFPNPNYVAPLTSVTATSGANTFSISADNTFRPYVELAWDAVTSSDVLRGGYLQVRWKRSNELAFRREKLLPAETQYRLSPVSGSDLLNIEVRAYNGLEVSSEPVFVTHTVSGSVPTEGQMQDRANLVPQASLLATTEGWKVAGDIEGANSTPDWRSSFQIADGANDIIGEPGNAILNVNSALTQTGQTETVWLLSPKIQIEHLQTYLLQCRVMASYAHVKMWLALYQSGIYDGDILGTIGSNKRIPYTTSDNFGNRTQYQQAVYVGTVPTDQTPYARLAFECSRGDDIAGYAGSAQVGVWQPMVSKTLQKADTRPFVPMTWAPGPETRVTGGMLGSEMLGQVITGSASQPIPYAFVDDPGNFFTAAELIYDNPNKSKFAVLKATLTIEIEQKAGFRSAVFLRFGATLWDGSSREFMTYMCADVWGLAGGATRTVTGSFTERFSIADHVPGNTAAAFVTLSATDSDGAELQAIEFSLQYEQ